MTPSVINLSKPWESISSSCSKIDTSDRMQYTMMSSHYLSITVLVLLRHSFWDSAIHYNLSRRDLKPKPLKIKDFHPFTIYTSPPVPFCHRPDPWWCDLILPSDHKPNLQIIRILSSPSNPLMNLGKYGRTPPILGIKYPSLLPMTICASPIIPQGLHIYFMSFCPTSESLSLNDP